MARYTDNGVRLAKLTPVLVEEIDYAFHAELGDFSGITKMCPEQRLLADRDDRVEGRHCNDLLWQYSSSNRKSGVDWRRAVPR